MSGIAVLSPQGIGSTMSDRTKTVVFQNIPHAQITTAISVEDSTSECEV